MKKQIKIDNKLVTFQSDGNLPGNYEFEFGEDFFDDLTKFYKAFQKQDIGFVHKFLKRTTWLFAHSADNTIPNCTEWFASFKNFDIFKIYPEIQDLLIETLPKDDKKSQSVKKKSKKQKKK